MCTYQDTIHLLQPTIMFLRLFGVYPPTKNSLFASSIYKLYAALIMIVVVYVYYDIMSRVYQILNYITCFYGILRYVLNAGSVLVILVSGFLTNNEIVQFFKILRSIQKSLFRLNIKQPLYPSVLSQHSWLAFHALPIVISVMVQLYTNIRFDHIIVNIFISMVRSGIVCKARVLMDLLRHKLTLLNWHLKYLNHYWPPFLPRPVKVFKELSEDMEWRRSKFVYVGMDTEKLTADKAKEFNKTHLKLHYSYKKLNHILSIPLLALYVSSGLNVSYYIFFMTNGHMKYSNFAMCIGIAHEICGIILISSLSSICEKEFQTTAHLVHDLLNDETHSQEVITELEKFSMILLHRNHTFSAAGFFDINLKIVTRMASLFAPIILFLVQNNNRPRAARNTQQ